MGDVLGLVATSIFAVLWALVCYVVVVEPPPHIPSERMTMVYVILACGIITIFRSFACGF